MSATSGTEMPREVRISRISPRHRASDGVGVVMRTISHPTRTRRSAWAAVAATSLVNVVVIDWMRMGFIQPTPMAPTLTSRVRRLVGDRRSGTYGSGVEEVMASGRKTQNEGCVAALLPFYPPVSVAPLAARLK